MPRKRTRDEQNEIIALLFFILGFPPDCSTGICGSLTRGYGKLDHNGYWEFQLYI